jgi:MFS family permease
MLEHRDETFDRVRHHRVRADALDAEGGRGNRDAPVDVTRRHPDEDDVSLGVGGDVRERLAGESGGRRGEREQELSSVHAAYTVRAVETVPLRRNRDFALLQGGQLLSNFGTQSTQIAYPLLVLAVSHSPADAGIVAFARALPMWLFALPSGLLADRFPRKRLMIVSDVVRAAAVAVLGALVLVHHVVLWEIAVVAFVEGAGAALFGGSAMAVMRAVVRRPQLPNAMSIFTARNAIIRLAGPPLGGVLFGVTPSLPFLADAGSYAFSTGSLAAMRTPFEEEREPDTAGIRTQLVEGMRFLWSNAFMRTIAMLFSLTQIVFPGVQLALVVIGRREGLTGGEIGGLVAAFGVALLLGSAIAPWLRRILPTRIIVVLEMWTWAGCALFLVWPSVYTLTATIIPTALAIPTTDSVVWPYILSLTPDRLVGRTQAAILSLTSGTAALGPLVAGFLLESVSARETIGILSAFGVTMAIWGTLSPAIRAAPTLEQI